MDEMTREMVDERKEEVRGLVICEMDYQYLVAFTPEEVEFLERRRCKWVNLSWKRRRNSIIQGGVNGGRNDTGDGGRQTK